MLKFKDNATDWLERIDDALEFRRKYGRESSWFSFEAMYLNLPRSGADAGPNLVQEMGDTLLARLGIGFPVIGISPSVRDPRSVDSYSIVQSVDNLLMSELGIPSIVQDLILHAYLWGRGIVKIGYDSEWGYDPQFDPGTLRNPTGMTLTQFTKRGKRLETGPGKPGMPWVMPILPHDFVVPWGTVYLEWAPWCAHRIIRHVDELKADPKYHDTRDLQPDRSMEDVVDSYTTLGSRRRHDFHGFTTPKRQGRGKKDFVELWEIHNKTNGRILTISQAKVHRNEEDKLQLDGLPFKSMTFTRHPRCFWTTPVVDYLKFHQAEQFDIAKQASKQRRINALKFLVKEGSFETDELEKALSPEVGIAAMYKLSARKEDITTFPQGTNFELFTEGEVGRRNARSAVGFSRNQLGEFDASSRRTATETSAVAQGAQERSTLRQVAVKRLYIELFRFLNQVIFTFWKTPRVVRVGLNKWPQFTGEEIRGEFSYNVDFGIDRPRDPNARRTEAFNIYLAFKDDPLVDPIGLRQYLARVFHDVEFGQIFIKDVQDAALSLQVSGLSQGTGGVQQNVGAQPNLLPGM